jgi:hypothetical protein
MVPLGGLSVSLIGWMLVLFAGASSRALSKHPAAPGSYGHLRLYLLLVTFSTLVPALLIGIQWNLGKDIGLLVGILVASGFCAALSILFLLYEDRLRAFLERHRRPAPARDPSEGQNQPKHKRHGEAAAAMWREMVRRVRQDP